MGIHISPLGKDKRFFVYMLYDRGNPISSERQENLVTISLILLFSPSGMPKIMCAVAKNKRVFLASINTDVLTISSVSMSQNFGTTHRNASQGNEDISRSAI